MNCQESASFPRTAAEGWRWGKCGLETGTRKGVGIPDLIFLHTPMISQFIIIAPALTIVDRLLLLTCNISWPVTWPDKSRFFMLVIKIMSHPQHNPTTVDHQLKAGQRLFLLAADHSPSAIVGVTIIMSTHQPSNHQPSVTSHSTSMRHYWPSMPTNHQLAMINNH